nr:hypothetical protein [Pedobacter panaciterrae]
MITVNIDNKKSEKVVMAVFKALDLNYKTDTTEIDRPLTKKRAGIIWPS